MPGMGKTLLSQTYYIPGKVLGFGFGRGPRVSVSPVSVRVYIFKNSKKNQKIKKIWNFKKII